MFLYSNLLTKTQPYHKPVDFDTKELFLLKICNSLLSNGYRKAFSKEVCGEVITVFVNNQKRVNDYFFVVDCGDNAVDFSQGLYKYGDMLKDGDLYDVSAYDYAYFLFFIKEPNKKLIKQIKSSTAQSLKGGCFSAVLDTSKGMLYYDVITDGFAIKKFKRRRSFFDSIIRI